ncbi:MAG: AMP-binding protein [Sandaracinaceae bacterium]|nr:AMP-binding protein [Sandaracinaceae bacterium]
MNELGQRLERALTQHAARVAVLDRGRAYLYGQLSARVVQVMATLREAGVSEGALVALGGGRDVLRVADLVALFKVGACPLLLCPRWPRRYQEECVRRSGATWSLAAGRLASTLVARGHDSPRAQLPAGLAYVVYTSGSAGVPKGVLVPHAGLLPVLDTQRRAFGLEPGSRSLFMLGLGFDASLSDLGTAILAGATLVLEDEVACAPGRLGQTLARHHVTYVDLPPAYLSSLDERALPPSLTTVVVGGEVPPARDVRRLAPHVALFNVYGPSEATICTSIARCGSDWSRPFIGHPIAGIRYSLRDGGTPGPHGWEGELVVEGPGVAYGYLGDEAQTRERFRDGPVRAFCTGDRVCRTPSGAWEFLGRVDRQLKRRGQLVAPEHVEAALLGAGPVAAATVSLDADEQLVATVERHPTAAQVAPRELEAQLLAGLREALPPSLVPDRVKVVAALPRTANGKVAHDRASARAVASTMRAAQRRAPACAPTRSEPEVPGSRPSDGRAALLAALMGAALGRAPLSPDDDFYAHGGDSLRALEVVARAEAGGLAVSVADVARGRTPRGVCELRASDTVGSCARATLEAAVSEGVRAVAIARRTSGTYGHAAPASLRGAHVLLTGATGTLGGALLEPLRAAVGREGRVHCLVRRPAAPVSAEEDLADGPAAGGAPQRVLGARKPVPTPGRSGSAQDDQAPVSWLLGDVMDPMLGLAVDAYAQLARDVGVVLHLAAQLNAASIGRTLMQVNVDGTRHVLQFTLAARPKALLHVSTLSIFTDAAPRPERCMEGDDLGDVAGFASHYAASKWAAERLLRTVDPCSTRTTVVRLGLLSEDHVGRGVARGHLARVIRGLAALGARPHATLEELTSLRFDATPVDHAARASLALLTHDLRHGVGGTYHVAAARSVSLARLLRAMRLEGVVLETCSWPELCARAAESADASGDAVLAALSLGRLGRGGAAEDPALDLFAATGTHFSLLDSRRALFGTSLEPPEPDERMLRRYVRSALA